MSLLLQLGVVVNALAWVNNYISCGNYNKNQYNKNILSWSQIIPAVSNCCDVCMAEPLENL